MNNGMTEAEAISATETLVAPAGYSEHQTGLAVDLGYKGRSYLNGGFDQTAAYPWLMAHCADYGFILRYPKDAEQVKITGYDYEPWHYRYVGVESAKKIMSQGLCLEEYLDPSLKK